MMTNTFQDWKDRIAWGVIASGCGIALMWSAWTTREVLNKPTVAEVVELIQSSAPYVEDRALIQQTIIDNKAASKELRLAIESNTQAIIKLQVYLEKGLERD